MKKSIAILLSICMIVSLCSCGAEHSSDAYSGFGSQNVVDLSDSGSGNENTRETVLEIPKDQVESVTEAVDSDAEDSFIEEQDSDGQISAPFGNARVDGQNDVEYMDIDTVLSSLEVGLKNGFGENYKIQLTESVVMIEVWMDGISALVSTLKLMGATTNDSWEDIKASTCDASLQYQNMVNENAGPGYVVMYCIGNDINPDNLLLGAVGGEVIIDVLTGKQLGSALN